MADPGGSNQGTITVGVSRNDLAPYAAIADVDASWMAYEEAVRAAVAAAYPRRSVIVREQASTSVPQGVSGPAVMEIKNRVASTAVQSRWLVRR